MIDSRNDLLQRCSISDRDCVDHLILATRQPRAHDAATPPWPGVRYSCDFCDHWPSLIAKCRLCERWVGLDCRGCALVRDRLNGGGGSGDVTIDNKNESVEQRIVVDRARSCRWCATERAVPPQPCGRVCGIVRRIVFVVEPQHADGWQFHVGIRMLCNVTECVGFGNVLFYGLPCGQRESDWIDAFERIGRFAADPMRFLPSDCLLDDRCCSINVVIAAHAMPRASEQPSVRLVLSYDKSRTLDWFLMQMKKMFVVIAQRDTTMTTRSTKRQHRHLNACTTTEVATTTTTTTTTNSIRRLTISEIFLLSCHLFPNNAVGEKCAASLRSFADVHGTTILACDGYAIPFVQVTMFSSLILTSLFGQQIRDNDFIPCRTLRFQSQAPTLSLVSRPTTIGISAFRDEQIQSLVVQFTKPSTNTPKRLRTTTRTSSATTVVDVDALLGDKSFRRSILDARSEDKVSFLKSTLLQYWPFCVRNEQIQGTTTNYMRLFTVAAIIQTLVASRLATQTQIANWIVKHLKQGNLDVPSYDRTIKNISFLNARLAHDGMLDVLSNDLSLEAVVVGGYVEPPALSFLRYELDMHLFDAALAELRRIWEQMISQ